MSKMPKETMKKIGLTGVMGAGKSSAIKILKEAGVIVLDCDKINAKLLQKGEKGYLALLDVFHETILDESTKEIDKVKMSQYIFSDEQKKAQTEAILHPLIKQEIDIALKQYEKEALVVVEVPLLFEIHWEHSFDEVWVIACDDELLLQRLSMYRHVNRQEAQRRLAHQMSQEEKIKRADVVFYNNKDTNHLKAQIYDILKEIKR